MLWHAAYIPLLLLLLTTPATVTGYNIDNHFTMEQLSTPNNDLQFGYTLKFLNKDTLIVGAPPAPPHNRRLTGNVFSCDIHSGRCKAMEEEQVKMMVPAPTAAGDRCFKSRYVAPCGSDVSTAKLDKWYFDPVFTNCKLYKTVCKKDTTHNLFDDEGTCMQTCLSEIQQKAMNAVKTQRTHRSNCVFFVQNVDVKTVLFYEKLAGGGESMLGSISVNNLKKQTYACGRTFVAKYEGTSEYLYFLDEENRYDVVLKPRYETMKFGMIVSVGGMQKIGEFINTKTFAPMGLSLTTAGQRTVACQPHYSRLYLGPAGRCSFFNETRGLQGSVIPVHQVMDGDHYKYAYSLSGFSTAATQMNPELLFVGAPYGGGTDVGAVVAIYASGSSAEIFGLTRNPLRETVNREKSYGNMWGFSLAAGDLHKRRETRWTNKADVVGGAPRGGDKLDGVVMIVRFSSDLHQRFEFLDKIDNPDGQVGSYFGAAVCMADVNSDGKDDVFVGAPYFSGDNYDEGRVYAFITKKGDGYKGVEKPGVVLKGKGTPGGRFGTTIVNIGDINKDGFVDVAVGAPGGERGAVYIFNGNSDGVNEKYSQLIDETNPVEVGPGFGISISSGIDVNGDSYGDIAVGGYLGGKAYVFKSRPVIYLQIKQTVTKNDEIVEKVPPEPVFSNCESHNHEKMHCVDLVVTMSYEGEGTPETFVVNITNHMDVEKTVHRRATLHDDILDGRISQKTTAVTLKRGEVKKIVKKIDIKVGNNQERMDLFTPIALETTYHAVGPTEGCGRTQPCPILAPTEKTRSELVYEVRCTDRQCKPYLDVTSNLIFPKPQESRDIVYGVTNNIIVNTTVRNLGETAYQPRLHFTFHSDFEVVEVRVDRMLVAWEDIGEAIPLTYTIDPTARKEVMIKLSLSKRKPSTRSYAFESSATAIGIENRQQLHNFASFNVSTRIETCLRSEATVDRPLVFYYEQAKMKLNLTKHTDVVDLKYYAYDVRYTFYVKNEGENTLDNLQAEVNIVDEVKGVGFMCVEGMFIDAVPCTLAPNCPQYLQQRRARANITLAVGEMMSDETNVRRIRCPINSIRLRRRATITLKTLYFPDSLSELGEFVGETFADGLSSVGAVRSNFTATLKVSHDDNMKSLYYQRKQCSSDTRVTVEFIDGGEVRMDVKPYPMWKLAAAVAGGLLLLLCLILLLIKLGFFKRKQQEDENAGLWDDEDEESDEEGY